MDDLKEILAAATPGPWIFDEENVGKSGEWCWQLRTEYGGTPVYVEISNRFNRDVRHEANARLIAMAPDLAAEVLRLQAEVERLTERLEAEERISRLLGSCRDIQMLMKMAEQLDRAALKAKGTE